MMPGTVAMNIYSYWSIE